MDVDTSYIDLLRRGNDTRTLPQAFLFHLDGNILGREDPVMYRLLFAP